MTRESNKREKAARIRDAALALLREKGFEATTTREVAERAGVAAGTLFLYVKTKDELVDFVFREEIARVCAARFASLRRGDVVGELMHLYEGLLELYARDRDLSRLLLRHALFARQGSDGVTFTMQFIGQLAHLVAAAVARGEITSAEPPSALAMQSFFLYLGAALGVVGSDMPVALVSASLRHGLTVHFLGQRPRAASPLAAPVPVPTKQKTKKKKGRTR